MNFKKMIFLALLSISLSGCHEELDLIDVVVPDGVTCIDSGAYSGRNDIKSITIPDSVTYIGDGAFDGCSNLTSINIPDGVTSIGDLTFSECDNLKSLILPDSVTSIGREAFYRCSKLTSLSLSSNLESIDSYAFYGCSSLRLNIYDNAQYLGNETNPYIVLIKVTDRLIFTCHVHANTKIIADYAFFRCVQLDYISLPEGLLSIGYNAFDDCHCLSIVNLPDSLISIGREAFYSCPILSFPTIPSNLTSIGYNAFSKYMIFNEYNNAFYLGSTTNPYMYLIEADSSYVQNSIVHQDTKLIADCAFINYPDLTSIILPEGLLSIGYNTFCGSNLTSITLPNSVEYIGDGAFSYCYYLTSVFIPVSVVFIGSHAFSYSDESLTIYCEASSEPSGWSFDWNSGGATVIWGYTGE